MVTDMDRKRILKLFQDGRERTMNDVMVATNLSAKQLASCLAAMKRNGILRSQEVKETTIWRKA